jgi:hypothetical protein
MPQQYARGFALATASVAGGNTIEDSIYIRSGVGTVLNQGLISAAGGFGAGIVL